MATIKEAQQFVDDGNIQAALEAVYTILRTDPQNTEAWQMAVDLAPDDSSRAQAEQGLDAAIWGKASPPGYVPQIQSQPQSMQDATAAPVTMSSTTTAPLSSFLGTLLKGPTMTPFGLEKDYKGEAILTVMAYVIGTSVVGLIANVYFLFKAAQDRQNGITPRNLGCLWAVLAVNIVSTVFFCLMFALPFFLALLEQ
jgi:hypothetical protein